MAPRPPPRLSRATYTTAPGTPLIRRFLDAGIAPEDLARFARLVGYEVAFRLCYHLGDPTASHETFDDGDETAWALHQIDPHTGDVVQPLVGVHESLLTADPTGTEMRPPAT